LKAALKEVRYVRKMIFAAAALAVAALAVAACGKKVVEGPTTDEIKSEIAGLTDEINAYLNEHNFANTDAATLAGELNKLAAKYGEIEKRAQNMRTEGGDEKYGDVGNLADEGRAKAEALASVIGAGAPMGDAAKMAELDEVAIAWADYSDRVGAAPGEAEPVEGGGPAVGEPAGPGAGEPGEPGAPGETAAPGAPTYPGRGHHYGWWKNPEWARDRGTRPMMEGGGMGGMAGTGEMERERERDRSGKGTGPEREREHMESGSGMGGGMGPGGGMGRGGGSSGGKGKGGK
jgi:translation initiation factor IF-2